MNDGMYASLTRGHLLRHAPAESASGYGAAVIDVAQDLLLAHLESRHLLELLAFKGGTAIRKVYAGAGGRFSTDLDFAISDPELARDAVLELLTEEVDGVELPPFRYRIELRRTKTIVRYESEFDGPLATTLDSKLDVGPPPWLPPVTRSWVHVPVHDRYRGGLPHLPVVDLAENVAEKIARLNRTTLARDAYDLVWITKKAGLDLDREVIRRLAALKIWVDLNGLSTPLHTWIRQPGAAPFDVDRWLVPRGRREFDDESIGLLTTPPPDLDDLGRELAARYSWLSDLDPDERVVARCREQDRGLVLRMIAELPGNRLRGLIR